LVDEAGKFNRSNQSMITDQARLDELLVRVRRFVREVAMPNEDRVEQEDRVGEDIVAEMKQRGRSGLTSTTRTRKVTQKPFSYPINCRSRLKM
jgi:hypothetical protein